MDEACVRFSRAPIRRRRGAGAGCRCPKGPARRSPACTVRRPPADRGCEQAHREALPAPRRHLDISTSRHVEPLSRPSARLATERGGRRGTKHMTLGFWFESTLRGHAYPFAWTMPDIKLEPRRTARLSTSLTWRTMISDDGNSRTGAGRVAGSWPARPVSARPLPACSPNIRACCLPTMPACNIGLRCLTPTPSVASARHVGMLQCRVVPMSTRRHRSHLSSRCWHLAP